MLLHLSKGWPEGYILHAYYRVTVSGTWQHDGFIQKASTCGKNKVKQGYCILTLRYPFLRKNCNFITAVVGGGFAQQSGLGLYIAAGALPAQRDLMIGCVNAPFGITKPRAPLFRRTSLKSSASDIFAFLARQEGCKKRQDGELQ